MVSGLAVGEMTPSFPVLAVTGPHKGKSLCYVCEYRNAPVVFAFFRQTDDEMADVVKKLDQLARQHRELKVVTIVTAGPGSQPWLERFARENGVAIPLTVFRNGTDDPAMKLYKLNASVHNTVLISLKRKVAANLVDVNAESFNLLTKAVSRLFAQK